MNHLTKRPSNRFTGRLLSLPIASFPKRVLIICGLIAFSNPAWSAPVLSNPTPLCLGDIAFTGFQSDNPDMFSFIVLKDIAIGTKINFTDNGWFAAGGFRDEENTMTLTFTVELNCGDEVKVDASTSTATDLAGSPVGVISGTVLSLSIGGDQIFAYQGDTPTADNEDGFIAAIHFNGPGWNVDAISPRSSAKPCVFEDGVTSIVLTESDNGIYGCVLSDGPLAPSMIRSMVNDTVNWTTSPIISFTYPPDCNYTCTGCTFPTYDSVYAEMDTICLGDEVELNVMGDLNDATDWVWYTRCCGGGMNVGTGASITVSPNVATTYYVRGEGGCVDVGKCEEVEVTVIVDTEAPVPACLDINVTFNGEDEIFLDEDDLWDEINSTDNCGSVDFYSISDNSVLCSEIGDVVPVTVTLTDLSGNQGTCVANVIVGGLPCGLVKAHVDCPDGVKVDYNASTETFSLTSDDCYAPGYYRPADSQALIITEFCGDGEIIAEVTEVIGNGWAGICMREGTNPSDRMIQLLIDGSSLTSRELRVSPGGFAFKHVFQTFGRNWLRLNRSGNTFRAYHSTNGANWSNLLTVNIPMGTCLDMGLTTVSGAPGAIATGVFENVSFSPLIAPLTAEEANFEN